ncbi:hypothetical protein N9B03_08450 [Akkermansiaceae bacterium]|nr:hypothetical protein [Akkermansiaceae bacterium]
MRISKLKIFFAVLLAVMALCGCDRSKKVEKGPVTRDIEGQAFIVTEDRNNVKLGLLDVYVADQKSVSNLLNDLRGQVSLVLKSERQIVFDRAEFESDCYC